MKNIIIIITLLLATACGKWTEIDPKGANMLQTVEDLNLLLNNYYYGSYYAAEEKAILVGDILTTGGYYNGVHAVITEPNVAPLKTAAYTWDERIDRVKATETDGIYTGYYGIIGKICNPVLLRADAAEGDRDLANRYKAEAHVLRAYYHYLLVNFYAKAYDPATAAGDGGIPYSRETDVMSVPNEKLPVKEVYDLILEDLDAAFALNSLSAPTSNRMRVNTAFAHAVKAKVLMSTRDYEGAHAAAAAALAIENTVDDHNAMLTYNPAKPGFSFSRPEMSSREDLLYAGYVYVMMVAQTAELKAAIEPGHILFNHIEKYPTAVAGYAYGLDCDFLFDQSVYLNSGGLSTVDMYLVQAECLIRKGDAVNITAAMGILNNNIRRNRVATAEVYAVTTDGYSTPDMIALGDYYTPLVAANQTQAIAYLKQQVRAENWYGPKRFISVKRWNTEEDWKETLSKHVECVDNTGQPLGTFDYTLAPGSPLYISPFPSKSTGLNANLTQNY